MSFLDLLKKQANKTHTENGALTYASTNSACLDLFYQAGALRNTQNCEIENLVLKAFIEDNDMTMRILFYARDIRQGLGERRIFRIAIKYLATNYSSAVMKNLNLFAEYGRWDDLFELYYIKGFDAVINNMVKSQIKLDLASMNIDANVSLLAKWMPSVNASSNSTRFLAKKIAKGLEISEKKYRTTLSKLRKYIDILENRLREKDYTFDYSKQPSKAMITYRKAFIRNDQDRYLSFLKAVSVGKATINTGAIYPYEIVRKALEISGSTSESLALDVSWNAMETIAKNENAIAVVDGSSSMYCSTSKDFQPYQVALSLGLYFAEKSKGEFANHFITFSNKPKLVKIKGNNIVEKTKYVASFNEVANTDLQAVFDLILKTATSKRVPQSQLPKTIYVISDMEFDFCARSGNIPITNFELAKKSYAKAGYDLPKIVFWNVNSLSRQSPVKMHESGALLVSGSSPKIFDVILKEDMDPYKFMLEVIGQDRYKDICA